MVNSGRSGSFSSSSSLYSRNVLLRVDDTLIRSSGGSSGVDSSTLLMQSITPIASLQVEVLLRFRFVSTIVILSVNKVL